MTDMLLEVDEALRAQQIKGLWDKYGQILIGAAVLITIGSAVGVFWHNHVTKTLERQTDTLSDALNSKNGEAISAALVDETNKPLSSVAMLYLAQKQERENKLAEAGATYLKVADTGGTPSVIRSLATYHAVRLGMITGKDSKAMLDMIEPLTTTGHAYEASALELKALLLQKLGKKAEADEALEKIATDVMAPNSLRQRARSLMQGE